MRGSSLRGTDSKLARAAAWMALGLATLLGACSVGFDIALSPAGDTAWEDELLGYWKVELEDEEEPGVALLHKNEDGTFRLDALGPDGGLVGVDLHLARHGGRDYAILDLGSFRTQDPGDLAGEHLAEQTALGVPLLPAGVKSYGIALLRREADRLTAYEMDEEAVKADLAGEALAGVKAEGCDTRRPAVRPDQADSQAAAAEGRPHWACILRIGQEAALRSYLEQRGEAIFNLEGPIRLTRLF